MNPYSSYTPKGTHIFVDPPGLDELIVEHGQPHEPLLVNGKATQYQGADVSARAHRERTGEAAAAVRMALEFADPETDWSPDGESWDDTGYESRSAPIATSIPEDEEIGEAAEDWWDGLGYSTGEYGDHAHPICSFEEIDTFDPDTKPLPKRRFEDVHAIAQAIATRAAYRTLTEYGRRAKKDALTVREHIDAAIKAAREGDAATMAEELYRASRAELEYGDDPSTRAARKALLGEGWIVDGGVLRYDPNTADLRRYEASAKET